MAKAAALEEAAATLLAAAAEVVAISMAASLRLNVSGRDEEPTEKARGPRERSEASMSSSSDGVNNAATLSK